MDAGICVHQLRSQDALALHPLVEKGVDVFSNIRHLWNPPWGRGIFGGAMIAQCLIAAQATVSSDLPVHSMHCFFILAADSLLPIIYTVERVRDSRSFATRTVQARQNRKSIFTTTISFMRESKAHRKIEHAIPVAADLVAPPHHLEDTRILSKACQTDESRLYDCIRFPVDRSGCHETRKLRHWIRARRNIYQSPLEGGTHGEKSFEASAVGHQAHVVALAYMVSSSVLRPIHGQQFLPAWRSCSRFQTVRTMSLVEHDSDFVIADVPLHVYHQTAVSVVFLSQHMSLACCTL